MELRHLRYFVAVAEERSFVNAARRVRVAQPALSKQIHDLEGELGVALFHRLPRGVRLTRAGETFLVHARRTLDSAERAVASARGAAEGGVSDLAFAHGELAVYTPIIEDLLAAFRAAHPEARVRVSSKSDADTYQALREGQVDVASIFIAEWPVAGFDAMRLVDCTTKGVLLPASHPLAARPSVRLEELRSLTWLQSAHGHSAIPSERVRSGYESLIGRFLPQRRDDNGGTTRCRGRAEPEVDHTGVQLFEQLRLIEVLQYQRDLRMVASQLLLDGTG